MAIGGVLVAATAASCNVMHPSKSNLEASVKKDRADDSELHVELAILGAVVAATIRHVCVCVCVCGAYAGQRWREPMSTSKRRLSRISSRNSEAGICRI